MLFSYFHFLSMYERLFLNLVIISYLEGNKIHHVNLQYLFPLGI